MAPLFDWWAKKPHSGTPKVVKMENPNNWSMVELDGPDDDDFILPDDDNFILPDYGKVSISGRPKSKFYRNKNAKQLTWVLLLIWNNLSLSKDQSLHVVSLLLPSASLSEKLSKKGLILVFKPRSH